MSWYRAGTVVVTNGSKTVTGVGTLFTKAVNVGDAFALVDANLNPTGAWYEVDVVVSNTEITLKQSYAGTTGSNNQYCVFNMVGNMTTPSFAQRLATFFASFQSLIEKPTTTPTASSIPISDETGKIDSGWIKDATASVKGVVELATSAETKTATDTTRAVTPAGFIAGLRGNLLGTVSQTGGVPTGAVIESGSNANGSYVKFADGTMVCRNPSGLIEARTASGLLTTPITFAAEFINADISIVSMPGTSRPDYVSGPSCMNLTKTSCDFIIYRTDAYSSAIYYVAIGRWY